MRGLLPALLAAVVSAGAATAHAARPTIAGCPVLNPSSAWNQRVDRAPVARDSQKLIASIGLTSGFHADFGSGRWDGGPIGIPYTVVGGGQRRVKVSFDYAGESDRGRYPIPPKAPIEGGAGADGDRHVLVVDKRACKLYELFDAHPLGGGASWKAGSGAIFDLRRGDLQRTRGWTSADAAGLPILPGLARYDEVAAGAIEHALRFTAPRTRAAFLAPAQHFASDSSDRALPPMGLRVRLKRSVSLRGLPPQARVIAVAMQRYGLLLADNGSPWYVSGVPSPRWDNDQLHALDRLTGRDFEVVAPR
ncbi:hypothetical protein Q5424_06080 [Conexibacter sp. JD483]|uniref:hypothetical protein n=1 Tax=unclassified Conexibacter TaxID=2627773 RepID=UPI00272077F8|nr:MULTISPECIES: hypothetical protein [unclassified Conexibacter]MDO8185151.1 hypothetical protein [Conexibacter sp. CPCC 205706]MDO8196861.1 hypothetical protein [Conexibacter sp. CPCC 205762]MDR9368637.1 hypothetical protein [Conexibacter sp. JD483]